ncbi:hypothetical protein [Mycobacterium sp. URHB0021]
MTFKKLLAALAIAAMLASGVTVTAIMIFADHSQPAATKAPPPRRPALPPPPPSVPTANEFTIGVVVTAQDCSPGGACVYTYTVDPKYLGRHPFPPTAFTVEYQVTGGHEPQPGKFTVQGQTAQVPKDVTVEGPPGARLQAVVTQVTG